MISGFVHPDFGGHLLMAGALLKAWHAPALVTQVETGVAGTNTTEITSGLKAGDKVVLPTTASRTPTTGTGRGFGGGGGGGGGGLGLGG